jgi:hypothetical protein
MAIHKATTIPGGERIMYTATLNLLERYRNSSFSLIVWILQLCMAYSCWQNFVD